MGASTFNLVSRDAGLALTEFSNAFAAAMALGDVDQWAARLGYVHTSQALRTKFPIPFSSAGYRKLEGEIKYRSLLEKSLEIIPEPWTDGVEAPAEKVEAPDFIGWSTEPAAMAREAQRHPNILAADVLIQNPLLDFYRVERPGGSVASTLHLFDDAHPYNLFKTGIGTFDNDWENGDTVGGLTVPSEINAQLVRMLKVHFRGIKGPNGRSLGLRLSHILAPPAQEQTWLDFMRPSTVSIVQNAAGSENVAAAVQENRHTDFELVIADELIGELPSDPDNTGDDDVFYAIASMGRIPPWMLSQQSAVERLVNDKFSDFYKRTLKVSVAHIFRAGAIGALPHAIVRVNLSA